MTRIKGFVGSKKTISDWESLKRKQIIGSLLGLFVFLALGALLSYQFKDQIEAFTQNTVETFGFTGLALIIFFADGVTTPIPPDLVLFVVAKSHLHDNWPVYLSLLCLTSVLAGNFGWCCGKLLSNSKWIPKNLRKFSEEKKDLISHYGPVFVALGALTPLPFSISCWAAGLLHVPWRRFIWGSLMRIPRLAVVYILISYTDFL